MKSYRALTIDEIVRLKAQACVAEDWTKIQVAEGFRTEAVYDVRFSGEIRLGAFDEDIVEHEGFVAYSGIRHATLHNVTVGDDTLIENVGGYISNYEIGDQCIIRNIGSMMTNGTSAFGNGVLVAALNEAGTSAFPICVGMPAPVAYVMATSLGTRQQLYDGLKRLVIKEVEHHVADRGKVGDGASVIDTRQIVNVEIGNGCVVSGASRLVNGTLCNEGGTECTVGADVIAQDFILSGGATLDNGATLSRCFVGQGSHISNHFTATDSFIASNCHFENGEACSIFAGPFTVSHHKNTLLIAGMFSFMNAGSGTNQSNHLYKTGPIHQGELQRGTKTGSGSYLMWPARVGAYSVVLGNIKGHPDTTLFPFSYLLEDKGKTYLVPGANFHTVGLWRDVLKWPQRDKRVKGAERDLIRFDMLNPAVMQEVVAGYRKLEDLEDCPYAKDEFYYNSLYIKKDCLVRACDKYDFLMQMCMGQAFSHYLKLRTFANETEFQQFVIPKTKLGDCVWQDLAGFVAPSAALNSIWTAVEEGHVEDIDELLEHLREVDEHYDEYVWSWLYDQIPDMAAWREPELGYHRSEEYVELCLDWQMAMEFVVRHVREDVKKDVEMAYGVSPFLPRHPAVVAVEHELDEVTAAVVDVKSCLSNLVKRIESRD
jgi:hypothetical protein